MSAPRSGPRLSWWLLGANLFVLLTPLIAVVGLRLYEALLVRQTERQLIAQSVLVGEAWRERWLAARGLEVPPPFRPPSRAEDAFIPVEPVANLTSGVQPPQPADLPECSPGDRPERRAGEAVEPLLRRAQIFNLSAARILDADGCVVATSRGDAGRSLAGLPEVASALGGRYSAIARERISDEPLPPISDVRSRGAIRVFTALPVYSDGKVVAVVRMSRTSLDALTSLWHSRRGLLLAFAATGITALVVSLIFGTFIARPLRAIARTADVVAQGGSASLPETSRWTPAEVVSLRQSIATMTERLRNRARDLAEYAAEVTHELKGPITAVRGAAELLREQWQAMDGAQRERFLTNIDVDAARMERLVNRLLDLARIGNAPEAADRVDVGGFFRSVAERFGGAVSLELRQPPARVAVGADHLHSAVQNLIENAVRYRGERPVEVTVDGRDGRLVVSVRDHGPGISEANQPRIFQRFFTTCPDEGGTGLGLATVKAVAERYRGTITWRTGPAGTTFELVI
ncbi:MAG: ATP-binding protein [Anaeromyxobacteraceae bacterium]